jgi:protein-S-isoprenylcysteine O-methyltransferase Ste14
MRRSSKTLVTLLFCLVSLATYAQQPAEMADTMRSNGKIYVVVGIILIVLAGLIVYLFMLDRKVKKLENLLEQRNRQPK